MQIHTRTQVSCSALHLWIVLRRVELFERWNPYVIVRRHSFDPDAIQYYFTNDPCSGLYAIFTGTLAIDDPRMSLTIRFGSQKLFRFVETLWIERTPEQQWLHHDLAGEGLGVKLMGRILARRIRPMMLHANAMLEEFLSPQNIPVQQDSGSPRMLSRVSGSTGHAGTREPFDLLRR